MEKPGVKSQHYFHTILGVFGILVTFFFFIVMQSSYNHRYWTTVDSDIDKESPKNYSTIVFFVETSGKPVLTLREACSVESAAHHNPQLRIRVLSLEPFNTRKSYMHALSAIVNVELLVMNLTEVFSDTPLYGLYQSGIMDKSSYPVHHMSDASRLALLWKLGGIYLDTDTITLRSLEGLQNVLGLQYSDDVANGVLFFQKNSRFLQLCMTQFANSYEKDQWGHQGPVLVTKILKETCNVSSLNKVINKPDNCHGIRLLPEHDLLPIGWHDWKLILTEKDRRKFNLTGSYMVHLYGALSHSTPVKPGTGVLLDILAKENCPQMYKWMLTRDMI